MKKEMHDVPGQTCPEPRSVGGAKPEYQWAIRPDGPTTDGSIGSGTTMSRPMNYASGKPMKTGTDRVNINDNTDGENFYAYP